MNTEEPEQETSTKDEQEEREYDDFVTEQAGIIMTQSRIEDLIGLTLLSFQILSEQHKFTRISILDQLADALGLTFDNLRDIESQPIETKCPECGHFFNPN